jgi:endo-1,4-beta-xylanase
MGIALKQKMTQSNKNRNRKSLQINQDKSYLERRKYMRKIFAVLAIVALCGSIAQAGTGSCSSGSFKVSFSGASFVTGLGWSSGGSRTINFSGSCSGCNVGPIIYGWGTNPLVEYYIGRGGGSSAGSYSTSKGSYTLQVNSCNGPNITGSGPFTQYNCSGSNSSGQNMSEHYNGWSGLGKGTNAGGGYCVVMVESWSGGSGSASVSVPSSSFYSHWVGSGTANFTCGSASTTTTTTSGGSTTTSGGGSKTIDNRRQSKRCGRQ